ncbi:MAG: glutamate--tRNA ligase family protein [Gemmatimonas sp.]|jgi:glutamyl-Q tRNA(Asp) synthetase|uniref:glutamate--tRNA ligase family protein n=1 Tax=Gemmatimonas sp. TaxID=1962908 RepID=UPI00391F1D1F|nr:glutamate--tRNA ligase family protein [Gemmatimonadota bacterium]
MVEGLPHDGWRTRFAPAPTGFLHLGHLVNALHVWGIARAYGGQVVLRLEDHDRTRWRPEYEAALLEDLDWLGLVPDMWPTPSFRADAVGHPARQSNQTARYAAALVSLETRAAVYACRCTRRDIAMAVPHAPGVEPRYPGTCRTANVPPGDTFARRVTLAPASFTFTDLRLGPLTQAPWQQCGDVLVRDRHDQWTYQFAVVVDDMTHGIDLVIRGEDLLASTGRQLQLGSLLGREVPPTFLHHMLLVHADGSKLSKARHDTAIRELRAAGATASELFGVAAARAGLHETPRPLPVEALPELFR